MRCRMVLVVAVVLSAMAGSSARAEDWCGYAARAKSIIECGYSTAAECESVIGKGGMCFIDPDLAMNPAWIRRAHHSKMPTQG